jgi:hypothetical protein
MISYRYYRGEGLEVLDLHHRLGERTADKRVALPGGNQQLPARITLGYVAPWELPLLVLIMGVTTWAMIRIASRVTQMRSSTAARGSAGRTRCA